MAILNLRICNYQWIFFITKVNWLTYFIRGWRQPYTLSNLSLWHISCLKFIFQFIYITEFKQEVGLPYSFFQGKLKKFIFSEDGLLREVQQNLGTTCIFHFPFSALLVSKTKSENCSIPPVNLMMIAILYQIILVIGDSVLLGGFKLGDEFLYVYCVDAKFVEWRSYGYFILYYRHELWVEFVMRNVEFLCWECLGEWIKYLGLRLQYLCWRLCGVGRL